MKSAFEDIRVYTSEFKKHLLQYILLVLSLDLISQFIVIPLFRYVTTFVLQAGAIPFVSYQNVIIIITTHTSIFIILIIELILLMLIVYSEFAFLLIGVKNIKKATFTLPSVFKETFISLKTLRVSSLLLLIAYFIFIIPFAGIIFRTPLLSKIQIPDFILDYMTRNWILALILILFYLVIGVLGLRLILTLPLMIFKQQKTWPAMKQSWNLTRKLWRPLIIRLGELTFLAAIILLGFYCSFYLLQLACDIFPRKLSFIIAVVNLTIIQIISEVVLIWSSVIAICFLFKPIGIQEKSRPAQTNKVVISTSSIIIAVLVMGAAITNILYLGTNFSAPLIISHRGVSEENGVQNTIPALKKTAHLKPDYVEIDLHETKDKQFVVMHDENLKKLTGVDKKPNELTLKELTNLTAKENGSEGKVASFDQYLKAAKKLHQKLLIEIKTTPQDSKKMLEYFNRKYGKLIIERHYQVQSLDYGVVENLHRINPKLPVLYIQPYNFTYPESVAKGYSMEYSTLDSDFIWQAHLHHHPVYAWTVNQSGLIKRLMYDHVDGIITDDVPEVKKAIKDFKNNSSYANKILNYTIILPGMLENMRV